MEGDVEVGHAGGQAGDLAQHAQLGIAARRGSRRLRRRGAWRGRGRLDANGRDEGLEVADAVTPIAARVDAQAAQASLLRPGANGVGVDAEDARSLGHRDGRGVG